MFSARLTNPTSRSSNSASSGARWAVDRPSRSSLVTTSMSTCPARASASSRSSSGRDAFARNRVGIDPHAPPGTYGQIAGFRIVTFTPQVAVVQLVSRFPTSGVLQVTTTTVRWSGGDWRLQLQPDGGTSPTAQAVPTLDGFVVWGL